MKMKGIHSDFSVKYSQCKCRRNICKHLLIYGYFADDNPKGNMGYDQYTVPDTVAVGPTFNAFL